MESKLGKGMFGLPIISFIQLKGGTGKTTLALLIALGLWLRGYRGLIMDTDMQSSMTGLYDQSYMEKIDDRILAGTFNQDDPEYKSIHRAMTLTKIEDEIIPIRKGLDLVPGSFAMSTFNPGAAHFRNKLREFCKSEKASDYDYIIQDSAGTWDAKVENVFRSSDWVFSPVMLHDKSSLISFLNIDTAVSNSYPEIKENNRWKVILNQVAPRSKDYNARSAVWRGRWDCLASEVLATPLINRLKEEVRYPKNNATEGKAYEILEALVSEIETHIKSA